MVNPMRCPRLLFSLALLAAPPAWAADESELGPGVSLTVYNQNFAVVKERRELALRQGVGEVKFPDVAATIRPDSVQFQALKPTGAKVLEQNYEFDLVSADKLLQKYLDKSIQVIQRDGGVVEGELLSHSEAQLVLADKQGIQLVPRGKNVKDLRFASLPEGLLTRPTLVWKVKAAEGGQHLVKVAYRADNVNWRVDYRAVGSADGKSLDLAGWVTINNGSGTAFKDAGLKLMAGDLNLIEEDERLGQIVTAYSPTDNFRKGGERGFQEKTFSEYHLYTLGRTTTLGSNQTKQIELLNVPGVPVTKEYLSQPEYGQRVGVTLHFKNDKATAPGLGVPLPKGPVRVYLRDAAGQPELIGADALDHTPQDEPVRLRIGYAFDLVAERTQTDNVKPAGARWNEQRWLVKLRNHQDQPATIVVREPLQAGLNWGIVKSTRPWTKTSDRTLEFKIDVPSNAEEAIDFTVRYSW